MVPQIDLCSLCVNNNILVWEAAWQAFHGLTQQRWHLSCCVAQLSLIRKHSTSNYWCDYWGARNNPTTDTSKSRMIRRILNTEMWAWVPHRRVTCAKWHPCDIGINLMLVWRSRWWWCNQCTLHLSSSPHRIMLWQGWVLYASVYSSVFKKGNGSKSDGLRRH